MTWRARPDMSCEYVNREWRKYTGYTMEQAMGQGWSRCLHAEDLARWLDTCVVAFDRREPFEIEYRLRRRDGEYRWVLERAAPRYSADELFVGFGGVCFEIDRHKRENETLARALERERRLRIATEEASRLRHGLMVSVLQELDLPSRAIATWAAHLRGLMPRGAALEAIERNARTQSRIIATLLELAQVSGVPPRERPLLSGVRVLVVGHNELVEPLEVAGADVRAAPSPDEALASLNSWRPDVVLAESNESFIRTLRSLPAERGGCLRAAALTDGAAAAPAAGYDAQLAKPVEPVALLATVARLAA
ncbi:MAG TPA: PAS domain-containing protein [Burkholderiales bacterium]|nr:PAS domain-containing protein [Burkholderiales bacterium]